MNYYYTFSHKFLRNFHSNLNRDQAYKVHNFLDNSFFKNNVFDLKMKRKYLDRKYGLSKVSDLSKDLRKRISNKINNNITNKNIPIDIHFVGDSEKKKSNLQTTYLTCKDIIEDSEKIENKIRKNYIRLWIGSGNKNDTKKLGNYLKRIFIANDIVYIIDRYLPSVVIDQKKFQVKGYQNTFECYGSLIKKYEIDYLHFSNVSDYQIDQIHDITEEEFEKRFKSLTVNLLSDKESMVVKQKCHEKLHERYLITFCEVPSKGIGKQNQITGVYRLEQGDMIRGNLTTENRNISKFQAYEALTLWENLEKMLLNKENNYLYVSKEGFRYN